MSQPPPPDTTGEIGPKWGTEYQQRTGDDGGTAVDDRDTAELADPEAPDPTPTVVIIDDPDYVEADPDARPVQPGLLDWYEHATDGGAS